jgi:PilZ domain
MLDLTHEQVLSDVSWDTVELSARIPETMPDFFERKGPTPVRVPDRRAFRRFFLRGKAILRSDTDSYGVYTVDASRKGIRIFSPIQLLPKLHVWLQLPGVQEFEIEIVRCCRLDERCYDCGAIFIRGI